MGKSAGCPVVVAGRNPLMDTQSGQTGRGGLLNNLWLQLALIAIGTVVLIVVAAKYLW